MHLAWEVFLAGAALLGVFEDMGTSVCVHGIGNIDYTPERGDEYTVYCIVSIRCSIQRYSFHGHDLMIAAFFIQLFILVSAIMH